jgi:hypothetical protein
MAGVETGKRNVKIEIGPKPDHTGRHLRRRLEGGSARGDGSTLEVHETSKKGRLSGLICWENYMLTVDRSARRMVEVSGDVGAAAGPAGPAGVPELSAAPPQPAVP